MADKEDAAPALGETEISRVQNVPTVPVPELPHFPEEGTKVFPAVRGQDLGDVLPQEPSGAEHLCDLKEPEREPCARVAEPLPPPGLREALAWRPADEDVDFVLLEFCLFMDFVGVSQIPRAGVMMCEHSGWEGGYLREPRRRPAERLPSYGLGRDSRTHAAVDQGEPPPAEVYKPRARCPALRR
jgi:hypothetical protein